MPTDAKRQAVGELAELLRSSRAVAVADYRGLKVAELQQVRRSLRGSGIAFHVVKNRLMRIAAEDAGRGELTSLLEGPSAVATTDGDEAALARALLEAVRPYSRTVRVRGGLLGGRAIDADALQRLSTLPSRELLLARLAGGLQAPMSGMAAVLAGNIRNLVGVLTAIADKKQPQQTHGGAAA